MNAIYMVAINHNKSNYKHSNFLQYSSKSWERWCEKNGVDFHCVTEHDERYGYPIWNKLNVTEICKDYDKIGIVDCDTMINIDAPNIFDELQDGISGVVDDVNYNWLHYSVENYSKFFNHEMNFDTYINAGVVFLDNKSLSVYDKLREFYFENQEELDNWNKGGGREQTLFNFIVQTNDYKVNLLESSWNILGLMRRELIQHNWQDNREEMTEDCTPAQPFNCKYNHDRTPHYIKYGNIYHFTGFPIELREQVMKYTWELENAN